MRLILRSGGTSNATHTEEGHKKRTMDAHADLRVVIVGGGSAGRERRKPEPVNISERGGGYREENEILENVR